MGSSKLGEEPVTQVFLNSNGFIQIVYHGVFDRQTGLDVINYVMILVRQLQQRQKPIYVLSDTRGMTKFTTAARTTGVQARKVIPFTKMAIVVKELESPTAQTSIQLTMRYGKQKSIAYFLSEEEATTWLNS